MRCHRLKSGTNQKPQYIVTLTSHGNRLKETAPYAIATLLNQSVMPDRIILWLAHGTTIPSILKKLTKYGVEIRFCEDVGQHTKLVPALKAFPNDILVTADDDVFYPVNWFEQLRSAYLNDPGKIYTHRAHEIGLDENNNITPYNDWHFSVKKTEKPRALFQPGWVVYYIPRIPWTIVVSIIRCLHS